MQYTLLALATAASFASAQSTIPLGENCDPNGTPCAGGADCYAVNSMLQTVCGNFQSSCTSDAQCAFNTCNLSDGLCNGFLATSSAASSAPATSPAEASSTAPGWMPAPSPTIVAPAGSLPLGAECNPYVTPSQCANGVQCWASNAGLIAACGKFNAACERDDQCDTNTCNNGLCNGFLELSSSVSSAAATMNGTMMTVPTAAPSGSAGAGGNGTVLPTGGATPTSTGSVEFTGAASVEKAAGGVVALVFGAVALAL